MEANQHLKINLKILSVFGLWPLNLKYKIINKLHRIYGFLVFTYFILFVTTEYIEIILTINQDFLIVVNNLSVSLLYTVTILKIKICQSEKVQKFVNQIVETENIILEGDDKELKEIYKTHVKWNTNLSKLFICLTVTTILPFYINPLLTELINPIANYTEVINDTMVYAERALPFSSWFPFDKNKHYILSFSLHIVAGCYGAFFTCSTDIFYWSFMIFGIGQLKILQHKFKNLLRDGKDVSKFKKILTEDGIDIVLRKSIMLHQIIINYINKLDTCLNFLMFMDFGICSMQIGVIGFQIIVSGFGFAQAFAMEYLVAMLIQMFLFYWHANEIIIESLKVCDAVWESEFYECTPSVQRSMMFVMMRSQKPLTLKVGSFYAMSTATAISIVRAGYSYVALMRQILNK